jgi:hypothetical protein
MNAAIGTLMVVISGSALTTSIGHLKQSDFPGSSCNLRYSIAARTDRRCDGAKSVLLPANAAMEYVGTPMGMGEDSHELSHRIGDDDRHGRSNVAISTIAPPQHGQMSRDRPVSNA